jgi:hypothetical protein
MVRREPAEVGGEYYRVLPEGRYENYDGHTLRVKRPSQGLDLNRNFPASWRQEFEQLGAGPYPTSEPEVRAVVDFIVHHRNIGGGTAFHTWSGVLLRPFEHQADDEMHAEDLWVYQKVGREGEKRTGYPAISVYHEFRYHPKEVIGGTFDWLYEHLGAFVWVVEIWSPMREAGIDKYKYIDWFRDHAPEDDLKLIRWSDEKLGGIAHKGWKPFDHPELGKVEIGGWNRFHAFSNPPPEFLAKELERFPSWIVWQALVSPKARARACRRDARGNRHVEDRDGRAEHGLAAFVRVEARARAERPCAASSAKSRCPTARRSSSARRATSTGSSKAARTSTPACRSGPTTT